MRNKGRYFKSGSRAAPEFKWTEPPASPSSGERGKYIHYKGFTLGELNASLGDFILIRSTDSMNQEILDCDVARLDELYHDFENKSEPYRAIVTWLCRPDFLPNSLDQNGWEEQGASPFNSKHEVVGEARQFEKDISAETIYYKCQVVTAHINEKPESVCAKFKKGPYPTYMHRFNMTMTRKNSKKVYAVEPVLSSSKRKNSNRTILGEKKLTEIAPKGNKRKASGDAGGMTKKVKCDTSDYSPELPGFVVQSPGIFGQHNENRTHSKRKSASSNASDDKIGKGKVVSDDQFTEVETTTGSGKKITIRCGDKKKFAPSSGLGNNQISSLLDSDEDFDDKPKSETVRSKSQRIKKKLPPQTSIRKVEVKVTPVKRTRRASVSCTTPVRKVMNTPTRQARSVTKRSASETKKSRKSKPQSPCTSEYEDSEDDFSPPNACVESDSDSSWSDDDESKPTKKKNSKTPTKATPSNKTPKRSFKPRVAVRSVPLPSTADPITEAQQRLHVSAVPDSLPCREEEFAEIFGYVESKLQEETGGCCYISGVPGTGKTATVMEVIRYLEENKEDYPDFNFYALNGMRLTSPDQAYVEMWKQMTGEKATAEHAMKLLDKRFNTKDPKRVSTIFLVDELDMLCNRKQSVLYNIFDWPSKPHGKLIVIAIANTMDLPERVMMNRVSSRLGLTRQVFQPYTHAQLQTIVASRLEGLQVFQDHAIQLVARKVASLSGDARRALDICRRATEMAEVAGQVKIGVQHVTKAHMEMFSSPKILAIRSCTKYEQMLLKVMVAEFHRTGVEETSVGAVFREHQICLRTEGLEIISMPGTVAMIARLSALRLVLAEHFKLGLVTKLRLNVAVDDIDFALKQSEE